MKALLCLCVLGLCYALGLSNVMWALDAADAALRSAYRTAVKESEARHHGR